MKKILFFSTYVVIVIAIAIVSVKQQQHLKNNLEPDADNPLGLSTYLKMRYANPVTGNIPFGAAFRAYRQLVAQGLINTEMDMQQQSLSSGGWQFVNNFFPTLAITKLTYDSKQPNVFYFCTGEGWETYGEQIGAGIFKSIDGGASWYYLSATDTSLFDYCQDIKVHPVTSDVYVATRSNGLMRSQDGGATWHKVLGAAPYQATSNSMCNIAFTKNGGIFCTGAINTLGGIYYSDSGDSGTWTQQKNGFDTLNISRVQIGTDPTNDSIAYAITCFLNDNDSVQGFYKTTTKGQQWFEIPKPNNDEIFAGHQANYDLVIVVDPYNPKIIVAGGLDLWRSSDGGNSWQKLSYSANSGDTGGNFLHTDQHEIVFVNADTVLFGNDGGVWETYDFNDNQPAFISRDYGYRVTQFYQADINPLAGSSFVMGGAQDNGSSAMQNTGISNFTPLTKADGAYCAIDYNNPDTLYTSEQYGTLYRIENNLSKYYNITNNHLDTNSTTELFINPMEMDPNNPDILYMASNDGLWRLKNASTATSADWQQACKQKSATSFISAIGISKSQPNTVYIGFNSDSTVYRIANADTTGNAYTPVNCDPNHTLPNGNFNMGALVVDPKNVDHVFAIYTNYNVKSIWETHNASSPMATWVCDDGNLDNFHLPVFDVFLNPTDSNVCYAATNLGVFYTTQLNGAATNWLPCNKGLPNVEVEMFKYRASDNTLIAATHGRGIFQCTVNDTGSYALSWAERGPNNVGGRTRTIMVDPNDPYHHKIWAGSVSGGLWVVNNIDSLPPVDGTGLPLTVLPNSVLSYPNPFSSIIHFSINISDSFDNRVVTIYDLNGRIVQQINIGNQNQFTWQPPPGAAHGLYLVQLVSGTNKYVQKIIYLN